MTDPETHEEASQDIRYAEATGKGDIHIPGAGTTGMAILIVSLTILFLASMAAYVIVRNQLVHKMGETASWPPPGMPAIPKTLWLSTIVILATSVTIQLALNAIRQDNEKKLFRFLILTFVLGVGFLLLQSFNWLEFYHSLKANTDFSGPYLGMFYFLTGLHAAHVLGGLVSLVLVIRSSSLGKYSRNFYPGVRYSTIYWHFLDLIWLVLFTALYF